MERAGRGFLAVMLAHVPRRTGFLARGLSMRFAPQTLRLRVGLIGRKVNRDRFYGRILQFGHKGKSVRVRRRTPAGRITYFMRVPARGPRPFIFGPTAEIRRQFVQELRSFWTVVLSKLANNGGRYD